MNSFISIEFPVGGHGPHPQVVDAPVRASEMGFGSDDVPLGDQEVHVVPKIGEGGKPG